MNLIRWEPFNAMDDMFNRFPALFGRWPRYFSNEGADFDWVPAADISETDKEYLIRATLPDVKKEAVEVTFADGMLTVCGERQRKEEQKDEKFHKVETYYGKFSRTFALPDAIDEKTIHAESKDGVLTVHVPKTKVEVSKPKTIRIQ